MTMIRFSETHWFQKDWKKLHKRYSSLPEDFRSFKLALCISAIPGDKHTAVIIRHGACQVVKIRMSCRSLGHKTLRVIYAYYEQDQRIELIELYYKGDRANEDRERIKCYLAQLEP